MTITRKQILIGASIVLLVLLSDVDALYTRPPGQPGARGGCHTGRSI